MAKIYKSKIEYRPLVSKGEKFIIINRNSDPNLMPIEARSLRTRKIVNFDEDELEEIKS